MQAVCDRSGRSFLFREATAGDARQLGELGAASFGQETGEKIAAAITNNPEGPSALGPDWNADKPVRAGYWVVQDPADERMVGLIGAYQLRWIGQQVFYVGWFCIHPDFQNNGLGTAMYQGLEDRLRALGCRVVMVETADTLEPAVRFYARRGFHECARVDDYWSGGDALLLLTKRVGGDAQTS